MRIVNTSHVFNKENYLLLKVSSEYSKRLLWRLSEITGHFILWFTFSLSWGENIATVDICHIYYCWNWCMLMHASMLHQHAGVSTAGISTPTLLEVKSLTFSESLDSNGYRILKRPWNWPPFEPLTWPPLQPSTTKHINHVPWTVTIHPSRPYNGPPFF